MSIPLAGDGVFWAMLTPIQKERVLNDIAEEASNRFKFYVDSLVESFDFRDMGPDGRMAMYQARSLIEWQELQVAIPDEYSKQMRDWYVLERRIKQVQQTKPTC